MMLGDKIIAEEAERIGMIYKVFSDTTFMEEAQKIAATLAELPTNAIAYTKQALNKSFGQNLQQQLRTEDELQQKAALTKDFREGVTSFIEKRKPNFTGQ